MGGNLIPHNRPYTQNDNAVRFLGNLMLIEPLKIISQHGDRYRNLVPPNVKTNKKPVKLNENSATVTFFRLLQNRMKNKKYNNFYNR